MQALSQVVSRLGVKPRSPRLTFSRGDSELGRLIGLLRSGVFVLVYPKMVHEKSRPRRSTATGAAWLVPGLASSVYQQGRWHDLIEHPTRLGDQVAVCTPHGSLPRCERRSSCVISLELSTLRCPVRGDRLVRGRVSEIVGLGRRPLPSLVADSISAWANMRSSHSSVRIGSCIVAIGWSTR